MVAALFCRGSCKYWRLRWDWYRVHFAAMISLCVINELPRAYWNFIIKSEEGLINTEILILEILRWLNGAAMGNVVIKLRILYAFLENKGTKIHRMHLDQFHRAYSIFFYLFLHVYTVVDKIKWTEYKFWIIFSFIYYVRNQLEMFDVENVYRYRKYIFSI